MLHPNLKCQVITGSPITFLLSLSPLKVMCVQYWPAAQHREEVYSGIGVTVDNEEQLANFMIRTIRLRVVRTIH